MSAQLRFPSPMFLYLIRLCLSLFLAVSVCFIAEVGESAAASGVTLEIVGYVGMERPFSIKVTNASSKAVYIATDPKQWNGKRGLYYSSDEVAPSVAIFSSRVYPQLLYF